MVNRRELTFFEFPLSFIMQTEFDANGTLKDVLKFYNAT